MSLYNPYAELRISQGWSATHLGTDFPMKVGTPIIALFDGVLTNKERGGIGGRGGYVASLMHANGHVQVAMHLSRFASVGRYSQGDIIGYSGGKKGAPGAGISTGPHLHLHGLINGVRVPYSKILVEAETEQGDIMFGFIRKVDGQIAIINPNTGSKRLLGGVEWAGYAVNGAKYADVTDAQWDTVPDQDNGSAPPAGNVYAISGDVTLDKK